MKSWKIGAVAGLIAGIMTGIATFVDGLIKLSIPIFGLYYMGLETLTTSVIRRIAYTEIVLGIIWWAVAGLIYVRIYDLIPGKGILKGLVYSLGLYLIYGVRWASYELFYGSIPTTILFLILFYIFILSGLAFGASYEYFSNKYSVTKYKSKMYKDGFLKGIYPGAFAGLVFGLVAFSIVFLIYNQLLYPSLIPDIGFLVGQLGTHLFFNMVWCALFGMLFVRFYERIPSNGVLKGLIFSMVIYFFTTFRFGIHALAYGQIIWFIGPMLTIFGFIAFGIVLGYLYKPTK